MRQIWKVYEASVALDKVVHSLSTLLTATFLWVPIKDIWLDDLSDFPVPNLVGFELNQELLGMRILFPCWRW